MIKVGILTWHYYSNFGSALQAFALQQTITLLGYDTRIVNYQNPKFGRHSPTKIRLQYVVSCIYPFLKPLLPVRYKFGALRFRKKYMRETGVAYSLEEARERCKPYGILVCGSDQIWAPNVFNPVYMLSCAGPGTRKISYAASVGLNHIPASLAEQYKTYLSDFHSVSVREERGRDLLMSACGIEAKVVTDPTLLVDVATYRGMERAVDGVRTPYVFCYFLRADHGYRKVTQKYAESHGLSIVGVSANERDNGWMTVLKALGADEFLWLVGHAEAIFTDSYHGTIFSLLYHKNFWTFKRFSSEDPICQNSRIEQLNAWFGLGERLLESGEDARENDYDYQKFETDLAQLRARSIQYLKKSLEQDA